MLATITVHRERYYLNRQNDVVVALNAKRPRYPMSSQCCPHPPSFPDFINTTKMDYFTIRVKGTKQVKHSSSTHIVPSQREQVGSLRSEVGMVRRSLVLGRGGARVDKKVYWRLTDASFASFSPILFSFSWNITKPTQQWCNRTQMNENSWKHFHNEVVLKKDWVLPYG